MKKILLLLTLISFSSLFGQEDPLYSQYQFNQLMINPAYAGIYNQVSGGLISRFQWAGIDGGPRTNTATIQSALKDGSIGLGAIILNDRFGVSNNYEIQIASSYNINLGDARFAMGLQGGIIQYGYDFNDVEFDFFDDPEITQGHDTFFTPNFGVGFMYMSQNFFIGASIPRILDASVTDGSTTSERYKKHYYFTSGYVKEINNIPVKAMALMRYKQDGNFSTDLSLTMYLDMAVWAGVTIRDLKHFGVLSIFEVGKKMKIGYSFEIPSNSLVYGNFGTHEVSILFNFNVSQQNMFVEKYF